jgi:hypothetical protein
VRKFRNRRRLLLGGSAVVVAAAAAITAGVAFAGEDEPALPMAACTVERLPEPEGMWISAAHGIDPTGSIVAGYAAPRPGGEDLGDHALLWRDGAMEDVPMPASQSVLVDVNSSGVAVGTTGPLGEKRPVVYRDGEVAVLPGAETGEAAGINEVGDIAGTIGDFIVGDERPVLWPHDADAPVELPLPEDAAGGVANQVDESGTVVGSYRPSDVENGGVPYMWTPDGEGVELPVPTDLKVWSADAVNVGGGSIIGYAMVEDAEGNVDATTLRWEIGGGEPEVLDMDDAYGINEAGTVVGQALDGRPALLTSDGIEVLPGLFENPRATAEAISADGKTIAGWEVDQDRVDPDDPSGHPPLVPVVWTCE